MRPTIASISSSFLVAFAIACASPAGNGGLFFAPVAATGGAAGSACNPQFQGEGCFLGTGTPQRMTCDAAGTWVAIAACAAGEVCTETGAGAKKVTSCVAAAVPAGDAAAADGGDGGAATDAAVGPDAPTDATATADDAGAIDATGPDLAAPDVPAADAADPADVAQPDAAPQDSGPADGGAPDTAKPDAGPADAGPADTVLADGGKPDAGPADTAPVDTGAADGGKADVAPADAGPADTSNPDVAPADAGPADSGKPDVPPADGGAFVSCSGQCGKFQDGGCQCDPDCTKYKDCCADYASVCGGGCVPTCASAICGSSDGCGGKCAGACAPGLTCSAQKVCVVGTGPICGNGKCEAPETASSCAADCKTAAGSCSGICGKQSPTGCYCDSQCTQNNDCCSDYGALCGSTTPACGNGKCETGETTTCPKDCSTAACGNGKCESGEATTCPKDCSTSSQCPNGVCESGETVTSCPADCKTGCYGDFTLGSTFVHSKDTTQLGAACNPKGAPKNCPDGYWINFGNGECLCTLSCAAVGLTVGQNCTTDGKWQCQDIKATNASANGGKFCVATGWKLCGK